jgi:probable rRNA maturation factor
MSIEVINETDFQPLLESEFVDLAFYIYEQMKIDRLADLTIVFQNEEEIAKLHVEWMGLEGPTDVMSFPIDELRPGAIPNRIPTIDDEDDIPLDLCLGDIVICPTVAAKQAQSARHSTHEEMLLLATHGMLHLMGYDHADPDEKKVMFDLQRRLLLGYIANRDHSLIEDVQIEGLPE